MNFFNFDAAMKAAQSQGQLAVDFLNAQRPRLEAATPELINEVLSLFAAGKNRDAFKAFYANADWATLEVGAAMDVANSADFATKAAAARDLFNQVSAWVARALLTILVAGFLG
jgi:hypothetical protein